jgi:hypothetical protein
MRRAASWFKNRLGRVVIDADFSPSPAFEPFFEPSSGSLSNWPLKEELLESFDCLESLDSFAESFEEFRLS